MSLGGEAVAIAVDGTQGENACLVGKIVVGKDILELLSTAMYTDPRSLYREYVQNAADGIDEAVATGLLRPGASGRVDIELDPLGREIRIRDNGTGVPASDAGGILTAFGSSSKRGSHAR